jgi:hypothetical protein
MPVGGPFTLHIAQMLHGGRWQSFGEPIAAASNGTWNATGSLGNTRNFTIPIDSSCFGPLNGNTGILRRSTVDSQPDHQRIEHDPCSYYNHEFSR